MPAHRRIRGALLLALSAALAVLAAPLGGLAEHCGHPQGDAPSHHAVHGSPAAPGHGADASEDSAGATDCPHCPPAECGRQASCPLNTLEFVALAGEIHPPPCSGALAPAGVAPHHSLVPVPPTPPPQSRA